MNYRTYSMVRIMIGSFWTYSKQEIIIISNMTALFLLKNFIEVSR